MKKELNHPVFKIVSEAAGRKSLKAYVVGGWVRDLIMKRPSKDIDIVTEGDGIALAQEVAKTLGPSYKVHVYKNFGTAHIKYHDYDIEFVGARTESYQQHSRKPRVEQGTIEDDQRRRDFTINAMGISLNELDYGQLSDPFGGLADIKNKVIRTPLNPDTTYSDDPLRMMRAIRFSSQLNFDVDAQSLESVARNAHRIKIISTERITDELNKIIMTQKPSQGFIKLLETGLLVQFFPEMVKLKGVEYVNGKGHKDNFYHTLKVLDNVAQVSDHLWLRWAAILHDIAKPDTKRFETGHGWTFHGHEDKGARMVPVIFRKLRLPLNENMKFVQKMVLLHLRPIVLAQDVVTDSAVRRLLFEAGNDIDYLIQLCTADITSKNETKVKRFLHNYEIVKQKLVEVEQKDRIRNWQPPVSGETIMQTFSLKPGREVGIIKTAIREAILEGTIPNDFTAAYNLMLAEGAKLGLTKID